MAKKTLVEALGTLATQSSTTVTVDKSIMTGQGLTASSSNSPQGIIAALAKYWSIVFSTANRTANSDETIVVTYDGQTSRTEGSNVFRVDTYRVQLFKLTPPVEADPDDY